MLSADCITKCPVRMRSVEGYWGPGSRAYNGRSYTKPLSENVRDRTWIFQAGAERRTFQVEGPAQAKL